MYDNYQENNVILQLYYRMTFIRSAQVLKFWEKIHGQVSIGKIEPVS